MSNSKQCWFVCYQQVQNQAPVSAQRNPQTLRQELKVTALAGRLQESHISEVGIWQDTLKSCLELMNCRWYRCSLGFRVAGARDNCVSVSGACIILVGRTESREVHNVDTDFQKLHMGHISELIIAGRLKMGESKQYWFDCYQQVQNQARVVLWRDSAGTSRNILLLGWWLSYDIIRSFGKIATW